MFDSFCAYRFPYETKINIFKGCMSENMSEGFIIAPFDISGHAPISIGSLVMAEWSDLNKLLQSDNPVKHIFDFPKRSTTKQEHRSEVESIISELNGNHDKKTIAAKVIYSKQAIDAPESFLNLCKNFPDSFIFLYYTPVSGAWLGASPELLLNSRNGILSTVALAGTRPAASIGEWDKKNIKEQEIVESYIIDCFEKWKFKTICSPRKTRKAGKVEHILTEIQTIPSSKDHIRDDNSFNIRTSDQFSDILSFLKDLSPTPALCGLPKQESKDRIKRLEKFERGYYGGFCGPYQSNSLFTFYVNLRSIRFDKEKWCMFAGGGITSASNPEEEWIETERKADGIIKNLKFQP